MLGVRLGSRALGLTLLVCLPAAGPLLSEEPARSAGEEIERLVREYCLGSQEAGEKLLERGPQVVPEIRALFAGQDGKLAALVSRLTVGEIERSLREEPGLLYRGQFRHLAPLAPEGIQVLLDLFCAEDASEPMRVRAAVALRDVAEGEEEKKRLIGELAEITRDFLAEPWFEQEAGYLMAQLGDRSYADRLIERWSQTAKERPSTGNVGALVIAHQQLSEVYYRIGDYPSAIRHYQRRELILDDLKARVRPELLESIEAELALLRYNLACSLSLAERHDEAFHTLETALAHPEVTLEMVRLDGDLRGLRADPRYEDWRRNLEERLRPRDGKQEEPAPVEKGEGREDPETPRETENNGGG